MIFAHNSGINCHDCTDELKKELGCNRTNESPELKTGDYFIPDILDGETYDRCPLQQIRKDGTILRYFLVAGILANATISLDDIINKIPYVAILARDYIEQCKQEYLLIKSSPKKTQKTIEAERWY